MEHSFTTRRLELSDLRRCVAMCRDVKSICCMATEDYAKLLKRREAEITNADVAGAIHRASHRLGLLVDDIGMLAHQLNVGHTDNVRRTWSDLVLGLNKKSDFLISTMNEIEAKALERVLAIEPIEAESGSSSYSDYSASDSVSDSDSDSDSDTKMQMDVANVTSDSDSHTDSDEDEDEDEDEEGGQQDVDTPIQGKKRKMDGKHTSSVHSKIDDTVSGAPRGEGGRGGGGRQRRQCDQQPVPKVQPNPRPPQQQQQQQVPRPQQQQASRQQQQQLPPNAKQQQQQQQQHGRAPKR